jgi:hypothetical protein
MQKLTLKFILNKGLNLICSLLVIMGGLSLLLWMSPGDDAGTQYLVFGIVAIILGGLKIFKS